MMRTLLARKAEAKAILAQQQIETMAERMDGDRDVDELDRIVAFAVGSAAKTASRITFSRDSHSRAASASLVMADASWINFRICWPNSRVMAVLRSARIRGGNSGSSALTAASCFATSASMDVTIASDLVTWDGKAAASCALGTTGFARPSWSSSAAVEDPLAQYLARYSPARTTPRDML